MKGAISNLKDASEEVMFETIAEDKTGLNLTDEYQKYDPEPNDEEWLKGQGATILDSTTLFPASGTTITKRSLTPNEWYEQRQPQDE